MNRAAIWISKEFWQELNKERGKIKAKTGKEPTWEEFLRMLFDTYKKRKEGVDIGEGAN